MLQFISMEGKMQKNNKLYNEVKKILLWGYEDLDPYVMDVWGMLAKGITSEELFRQIMITVEELGIGPTTEDLLVVVKKLITIQPEIQKYAQIAKENKEKFTLSDITRKKELSDELESYLDLADKDNPTA